MVATQERTARIKNKKSHLTQGGDSFLAATGSFHFGGEDDGGAASTSS